MRTQSNKHLLSLTILLSLTTIVFCYGPQSISLFPAGTRVISGREIRMSITHRIRYYAMPVLANQDSMADPVFAFYNSLAGDPVYPERIGNCPFYRPTDFTYKDESGRENNCWRMYPSGAYKQHWGLDIQAPEGTPIVAADTGIVTYAGPFKRGYLGAPIIYVETFYFYEDSTNPFSLSVGYREYKVHKASINTYDWSGWFGNVVLVYYPHWNRTIQYSHLQDFEPGDPCYQSIDSTTQYVEDTVVAWDTLAYVGRTGYDPDTNTARIHVDIMVYKGKRRLFKTPYTHPERVPSQGQRIDGDNIEDPYPWLYYKSIRGRMDFVSKVQEKDADGNLIGDTVVTTDTLCVGNMEPFSPIPERQSGRIVGYLTRYWYDEHPASYSGFRGYHHLFSKVGFHALLVYLRDSQNEILLSCGQNWIVIPPLSKLAFTLERESKPKSYFQISPNPFNSICRITGSADLLDPNRKDSYSIAPIAVVYDIKGQKVSQIEIENTGASYKIDWDGTDESGQQLPSGAYFIRFIVNEKPQTAKVTLLR